jgi:hypothetical protein
VISNDSFLIPSVFSHHVGLRSFVVSVYTLTKFHVVMVKCHFNFSLFVSGHTRRMH